MFVNQDDDFASHTLVALLLIVLKDHPLRSENLQDREKCGVSLQLPIERVQDLPLASGDEFTSLPLTHEK